MIIHTNEAGLKAINDLCHETLKARWLDALHLVNQVLHNTERNDALQPLPTEEVVLDPNNKQ